MEPGYEERYRFPGEYARLLFVCAAFFFGSLLLPLPVPVQVVELVVFGGGGVALLVLGLRATSQVALRVDAAGLAVGERPDRFRFTTEVVPWPEVTAVRLSRETGPPPLTVLTASRRGQRPAITSTVRGWKLDRARLASALTEHAPKVRFTDNA